MTHADSAHLLVLGSRNESYGNPVDDFARVAKIWSGILRAKLNADITPKEAVLCMVGLKIARETHRHKEDNLIDAHGYLLLAEWIVDGIPPTPEVKALIERIGTLTQMVEDVACGARLTCPACQQSMPCMCEHRKEPV